MNCTAARAVGFPPAALAMLTRLRTCLPALLAVTLIGGWLQAAPAQGATPAHPAGWTLAWYAPMAELEAPQPTWQDVSVRKVVRLGAAGRAVRITVSNAFGTRPLRIAAVRAAYRSRGAGIMVDSDRAVSFQGGEAVVIAPGGQVRSDTVELPVEADTDLAISLYFAEPATIAHVHDEPREAFYQVPGRELSAPAWPEPLRDAGLHGGFAVVQAVEVLNPAIRGIVVAFGDSITDGYGVGSDQGMSWPEQLNRRLQAAGVPLTVVNAGLSGNALLSDNPFLLRYGRAATTRVVADLLAPTRVCAVIVAIGVNDIGLAQGSDVDSVATRLADGYRQLVRRLHAHHLPVYAATLTPFRGAAYDHYDSPAKQRQRRRLNQFIRQAGLFDAVLDFDHVLRSPGAPDRLLPAFDSSDHLHPNAAGARAMAAAVPLELLAHAGGCAP